MEDGCRVVGGGVGSSAKNRRSSRFQMFAALLMSQSIFSLMPSVELTFEFLAPPTLLHHTYRDSAQLIELNNQRQSWGAS